MSLPPPNRLRDPRNVLLPVLVAQAVATAWMLGGDLDFLDWQLLTLAEIWLVHLTLLAYGRDRPFLDRLSNFALLSCVVLPALWMFLALLVTLMLFPDDARMPWTIVWDGARRLGEERMHVALMFVLAGLLVSLGQAMFERDRARWWETRVVAQHQVDTVAMLASLFLLGPLIILRNEIDAARDLAPATVDLLLLALLALLRAAIALRVAKGGTTPRSAAATARHRPRRAR